MKKNQGVVLGLLALVVWSGNLPAEAITLEAPVANLTEKWTDGAQNWVRGPKDWLSCWTSQAMELQCNAPAGDGMPYVSEIVANSNASSGYFVGSFCKIDAISFDAIPKSFTYIPYFYYKTQSGVRWKISFADALTDHSDGVPVNVVIPFSYSTNWESGYTMNVPDHFETDKANVASIGFFFQRGKDDVLAAQLAIDNLKLVGVWGGPFTSGQNPVPVAWLMEQGLPTTNLDTIGTDDSDGDGRCNSAEFLAGTDPTNSASYFVVSIERDANGKMALKWKNNKYASVSYDVLESSDLTDPVSFVATATNIQASATQVTTNVEQQGVGSRFYKVKIHSK